MTAPIMYLAALAACLVAAGTSQALAQASDGGQTAHRAAKSKVHAVAATTQSGAMPVDDWFSYGAPKEAEVEREAPGVQIKVHDPHEDDITVYGVRQKRDFEGATRDPNLTSPQALDAAQPVVPGLGDSCSYKYGCFDSSQPSLRSDFDRLTGGG